MKKTTSLLLALLFILILALPVSADNLITTRIDEGEQVVLYRYTNRNADSSGTVSTSPHSAMGHPANDMLYTFASKIDTDSKWKMSISRYGEVLAEMTFQMTDKRVIIGQVEYVDSNFTFSMDDFNFSREKKIILQEDPAVLDGAYVNPEYNLVKFTATSLGKSNFTQSFYAESLKFGQVDSTEPTDYATSDDFTETSEDGVSIVSELSGMDAEGNRIYPSKIKVDFIDGHPLRNGFAVSHEDLSHFDLIVGYSAKGGEIPDSFKVLVYEFGDAMPCAIASGNTDAKTPYFFTKVLGLFDELNNGYYSIWLSFSYPSTADGNGTGAHYQFILKITGDNSVVKRNEDVIPFPDLADKDWAKDSVADLVQKKVLVGYEDGEFRPDGQVTRSEFAKMMVAGLRIPLLNSTTSSFVDIPVGAWELDFVESAKNYLTGYFDGASYYYKGSLPAVREDMAVAMVRALQLENQQIDESELKDVFSDWESISPDLRRYVLIAYKNRLIDGYPDGSFGPQQSITRAETAAMIHKAIGTAHMTKVVMADRHD